MGRVAIEAVSGSRRVHRGGLRGLGILMTVHAQRSRLGDEELRVLRLVARVTGRASRGYRMDAGQAEGLAHLAVALGAQLALGGDQKRLMVGGVGIVTVEAGAVGRRVVQRAAGDLARQLVTVEADLGAGRRSGQISRTVARVARHLRVHRGPLQRGRRARVRHVAGRAVRASDGETAMAGREVGPGAGVVTARAERLLLQLEKPRVGASMRHVARRAIPGGRLMDDLSREALVVVAAQTQLSLGLIEDGGVVGAVRVVAARALLDAGMPVARRQLRLLSRVTLEA